MGNNGTILTIINTVVVVFATIPLAIQRWRDILWRKKREDAVRDDQDMNVNDSEDDSPNADNGMLGTSSQLGRKSRYSLNGRGSYGKGRLVLEVIKCYVAENPDVTYDELTQVFPKRLKGVKNEKTFWGCVNRKDDALNLYRETGRKRHFLDDGETIKLRDGTEVAVSSQWGNFNIGAFINAAVGMGFLIKELP